MSREELLQKTVEQLSKLPDQKLQEVSDYTEFLFYKIETQLLTEGIQKLTSESGAFSFLNDEEDLYAEDDLKEKYK